MADVDAVIAALRVVLQEADARSAELWWKTHIVNRWVDQLPGAWWGKWRQLRLRRDLGSDARRDHLITHVRATLAYLETNRDAIAAQRSWWSFGKVAPQASGNPDEVAVKKVVASVMPQDVERVEAVTPKGKLLH